jgi:hypothetical protein
MPVDPCAEHPGKDACIADASCTWIAIGAPCVVGEPCPSGICQSIGGGCRCACPSCEVGQPCPPCVCDCPIDDCDPLPGTGEECADVPACDFLCPEGTHNPTDERGCVHTCECVADSP